MRKYELNVKTYQSRTHLLYFIFNLMRACQHKGKTSGVLWKSFFAAALAGDWGGGWDGAAGSQTAGLKVCHGGVGGWGKGRGGGGSALTARHMEGCRFPPDRENGILNAYLRCYRWRSQRQRILYKAFWKAPLIFHQNCVYTRKQTKKEVCRLNPPCSLSLTHTHLLCSILLIPLHSFFFSLYRFTHKPSPNTTFCSCVLCFTRYSCKELQPGSGFISQIVIFSYLFGAV